MPYFAIRLSSLSTNLLGRRNALTDRQSMLDSRQLFDEAAAAGDNQAVILDFALIGDHPTTTFGHIRNPTSVKGDLQPRQKQPEVDDQIIGLADAGRQPDQAWVIYELRLGRHQDDLCARHLLAQFSHGSQGSKARPNYRNTTHTASPQRWLAGTALSIWRGLGRFNAAIFATNSSRDRPVT